MIHHYSYSAPPVQAELISLSLQVSDIRCMSPRRRGQVVLSRVRGACRSRHSTTRFYKRFVNFLHFEMLPLFRVNLLHLKVVFHQVRVNLFCVNLQYLNFMER